MNQAHPLRAARAPSKGRHRRTSPAGSAAPRVQAGQRKSASRLVAWLGLGCLAAALSACGGPSRGPGNYLLDDIDAQRNLPDSGWEALKSQLPPVPTAADTLPIEPLARTPHFRFGIDPRSISTAPGLIVRYTLRAVSDQGAENISYESIRCGTREWRTVALYRPDSGWQRAVNDAWHGMQAGSVQHVLRNGVFCSGGAPAGEADHLVYRLRNWERYADALAAAQER